MNDKCYICQDDFTYSRKRKRYERVSINSKLHRNEETVREVLKDFGCTPQKLDEQLLVCTNCAHLLSKHQSLVKQKEETFNEIKGKSSGYVGQKVANVYMYSPGTPHNKKRLKLSTPRKKLGTPIKGCTSAAKVQETSRKTTVKLMNWTTRILKCLTVTLVIWIEQSRMKNEAHEENEKEGDDTDAAIGVNNEDENMFMDEARPNRDLDEPLVPVNDEGAIADVAIIEGKLSYSIVFDNVNKHMRARLTDRKHGNTMKNMVQAYAAVDRVPSLHLSNKKPTVDQVSSISIETYLPDDGFRESLRNDFIIQVKKILKDKLTYFHDIEILEEEHQYQKHSIKKSKLIPLGVMNKDECKIAEMIDVMEEYHKYVPGDDEPFIIPLYGDQLSVERSHDAQNARINAESKWDQLQGFHPAIQEWHKRVIILEDTYKILYSAKSARSVGTLSHIRNTYRHINVKADVHNCFNEATDLFRFATTSYVIASALTYMNSNTYYDMPEDLPTDLDHLTNYFHNVASHVVEMCYKPPNVTPVISASVSNSAKNKYCVCKTNMDDPMIKCDNKRCSKGKWFHFSCMGIEEESVDLENDQWFCCDSCRMAFIKNDKSGVPDKDYVHEYTCTLLYRGLREMVQHNAIRTNNGNKIVSFWKDDLFDFFERNHTKYFICAHNLITDVNGGLSKQLAHQLVWNRTVNIKGALNSNIEMDLQMEFFNREFKESVKDAGGNMTDTTIARHSEMVGVSKCMGKFMSNVCETAAVHHRPRGSLKRDDDIIHLVNQLLQNKFCKKSEPRHHSGFPDIEHNTSTSNPVSMRKRISKILKKRVKRLKLL